MSCSSAKAFQSNYGWWCIKLFIGKSFKLTNNMPPWITLTKHNEAPEVPWMNQWWLALHITQIIFVGTFWRFAFNCHVLTPTFLHNIITRYLNVCSFVHSFFYLSPAECFHLPCKHPSFLLGFFIISLVVFRLLGRVEKNERHSVMSESVIEVTKAQSLVAMDHADSSIRNAW